MDRRFKSCKSRKKGGWLSRIFAASNGMQACGSFLKKPSKKCRREEGSGSHTRKYTFTLSLRRWIGIHGSLFGVQDAFSDAYTYPPICILLQCLKQRRLFHCQHSWSQSLGSFFVYHAFLLKILLEAQKTDVGKEFKK